MSGYLIFALVATLELVSPGTTHYGVDVISGGILASQYSVTVDGSVGRFVKTGLASAGTGSASRSGLYLQVERSGAFGHVYTAVPGPALNADAAASSSAASTAPVQLPPVAFSLAGMLNKLRSPAQDQEQRFTIEDPVAALNDALSVGTGAPDASTTVPAPTAQMQPPGPAGSPAAGASMTPTGAVPAASGSTAQKGGAAGLSVSVFRRNNLTYLELADQALVLVVHAGQ